MSTSSPPRGRPPLTATRRREAIAAFLALVAERGLDAVTLDDVARRAGMQRSVIRHYVGNRGELIGAALDELIDGYRGEIVSAIGDAPTIDTLLDYLFSPRWFRDQSVADRAMDELFHEALRAEEARERLKSAYSALMSIVQDALVRSAQDGAGRVTAERAEAAAYAIVCLAEHNVDLQSLGFDAALAARAREAAHVLALHAATDGSSS